ncbi:MAG: patatin-like phospholipase family protein [candidate division Zixibacteria bacterium]|nr:patatin-like phospholipase family protein [candidate division Zixibacteria bacterium]
MSEVRNKYRLGLALGGGGARGLAHVGVLKVLEREGIRPDLIVGTSMGAIIGAMYSQYEDIGIVESNILNYLDQFLNKKQWIRLINSTSKKDKNTVFSELTNYVHRRLIGLKALTRISLETKETLFEPLKDILKNNNIEDNKIPFAAVCLDLVNGKPVVITNGPIIKAVYASSAIEGVFPPLEYNGGLLADGGPSNITPIEVAMNLGAKRVAAVDVHQDVSKVENFSNGLEIIMRADNIGLERLTKMEIAMADVVITPNVRKIHWSHFNRARDCIRMGELAAQSMLPEIKVLLSKTIWFSKVINKLKSLK